MRTLVYFIGIACLLITSCGSKLPSTVKNESFHVSGNCGMCKKTIENSLKLDGVYKADWNKETKIIAVTFDTVKIKLDDIKRHIAGAGYDCEGYTATDEDYYNLHQCCQYDR